MSSRDFVVSRRPDAYLRRPDVYLRRPDVHLRRPDVYLRRPDVRSELLKEEVADADPARGGHLIGHRLIEHPLVGVDGKPSPHETRLGDRTPHALQEILKEKRFETLHGHSERIELLIGRLPLRGPGGLRRVRALADHALLQQGAKERLSGRIDGRWG